MWNYFKIEFQHFYLNKKNIAIYCLLLFIVLFYAIKIAPSYEPIEKVDRDEIEARYNTRQEFLDRMKNRDLTNAHPLIQEAIYVFSMINPLDEQRLKALDDGDLIKYAEVTGQWYYQTNFINYSSENYSYNPLYFTKNNQFARDDAFYAYFEASKRYEFFAKANYPLSYNLFEQKTGLQTLERLLKGPLPLLLLIFCLLLTVDIVTKDRRNPSLLKGLPLADWKKYLVKLFVALVGSVGLFIPIIIGVFIIGMQSGFGNLSIPVPQYVFGLVSNQQELYNVMSLGEFFLKCCFLLVLWFLVIIIVVLLCSALFKLEMLNLGVVALLIFGENYYNNRGVGFFWDIEKYPTTYIQVGQIVSGFRNFYYTTEDITVEKGVTLLLLLVSVGFLLTMFITMQKRYRYIK